MSPIFPASITVRSRVWIRMRISDGPHLYTFIRVQVGSIAIANQQSRVLQLLANASPYPMMSFGNWLPLNARWGCRYALPGGKIPRIRSSYSFKGDS